MPDVILPSASRVPLKVLAVTDPIKRLDWLQVLRGTAAVSVVISHSAVFLPADAPARWLVDVLDHLGSGVDLFFIISGFIMVHTTINDAGGFGSAVRFAAKRMQRIWPAYIVLTLLAGFARFGWGLVGDDATRLMLVRSLLFIPGSYDTLFADQIIGPGWTLGFEVYFYAVFAVSLLLARGRWLFLAAWCGVMLVVVPLAYGASLTGIYESWATDYPVGYLKIATSPFVWEFALGGLAAALHHSRLRIGNAWACRAIAVLAVIFAIWNTFDPVLPGTFGLAAGYAGLVAALSLASKTITLPALRPLRYCGDISYTLYIEHMLVIHTLHEIYAMIGLNDLAMNWLNLPVALAACLAVAALTSRFLERDMWRVFVAVCRAAWTDPRRDAEDSKALVSDTKTIIGVPGQASAAQPAEA
jgi:exopolysaccharide production protein ExoZ